MIINILSNSKTRIAKWGGKKLKGVRGNWSGKVVRGSRRYAYSRGGGGGGGGAKKKKKKQRGREGKNPALEKRSH